MHSFEACCSRRKQCPSKRVCDAAIRSVSCQHVPAGPSAVVGKSVKALCLELNVISASVCMAPFAFSCLHVCYMGLVMRVEQPLK